MPEYVLRTLSQSFSRGHVLSPHSHSWGQLIYAASGTMQVFAANTLWMVPPTRAVWAPAGVAHSIEMRGAVTMRTIYVPVDRQGGLNHQTHAVEVAPLLRELVLHIVSLRLLRADEPHHVHLADLFLDLAASAPSLPLFVPMPSDARAAKVATELRDDPGCEDGIDVLARRAGASVRTLQRLFREQTGMRLVEWRQRLRLFHAITRLEQGQSVTDAGAAAGYASTSAFIHAFRQQMGESPARYWRGRG